MPRDCCRWCCPSCVVSPPPTSKPKPTMPLPPTTPSGGPTPPFLFTLPYFLGFLHMAVFYPVDNAVRAGRAFRDTRSTYAQVKPATPGLGRFRRCRLTPSLRSVVLEVLLTLVVSVRAGCLCLMFVTAISVKSRSLTPPSVFAVVLLGRPLQMFLADHPNCFTPRIKPCHRSGVFAWESIPVSGHEYHSSRSCFMCWV